MMDYIMGMSPWIIGIVALIAAMVGWNFVKSGQSTQVKGAMKIVAVVAVVLLMFNLGWLAMDSGTTPTGTGVPGDITWGVLATSATDNTTVTGNTILTTYTMTAGEFTGAATGSVTIAFAASRTDTNIEKGLGTAYVVSVPSVTNTTSGIVHPAVTSDAQGVFDADFTVTVAAPMTITFPDDPADRSDVITLVIVFSANAIEALPQYTTFSLQYNIGGVVFTHNIMHMD